MNGDELESLLFEGQDRKRSGDIDSAIQYLEKFIRVYETVGNIGKLPLQYIPDTYYNLADLYTTKGDLIKAVEYLEKALALTPNDPDFLFNHGMFCGRIGNHQKAIKSFQRYLGLQPTGPDTDKVRKALDMSEQFILDNRSTVVADVVNSDIPSRYNAGFQLWMAGDYDRAIVVWESLLKEPQISPLDKFMTHAGICQSILCRTGEKDLKKMFIRLKDDEARQIDKHAASALEIKEKLTPDDLSQDAVDNAWRIVDSVFSGLMYRTGYMMKKR